MKFYAIKSPSGQKIVNSWAECERLTHGVKGCLFKSFASRAEAESWISGVSERHSDGLRVYVDGSFSPDFDRAGWAFVAVENGQEIASESGVTDYPAESRNIDGELEASLRALSWLRRSGRQGVICHDYEGIARWAKGEWNATCATLNISRLTTKTESREFSRSESLESSVSKIETTSALLSPSESLEQAVKARQKTKRARKTCCIKASGKKDKKKKNICQ